MTEERPPVLLYDGVCGFCLSRVGPPRDISL
jgi:hypothetical protein